MGYLGELYLETDKPTEAREVLRALESLCSFDCCEGLEFLLNAFTLAEVEPMQPAGAPCADGDDDDSAAALPAVGAALAAATAAALIVGRHA